MTRLTQPVTGELVSEKLPEEIRIASNWEELHQELIKIRDICTELSLEMKDWIFEQGLYAPDVKSNGSTCLDIGSDCND
jgi:hypothetical protein